MNKKLYFLLTLINIGIWVLIGIEFGKVIFHV